MGISSIQLNNIGVHFRLYYERTHTLKEYLINLSRQKMNFKDLWALKNISLDIHKGESVGIIGRNGCGKSTLLKVIAGVFQPTCGSRVIQGKVASLIELGAGFNGELTGRENIYLNGAIMGLSKKIMDERYDTIVDFAELHDFMDTPVKNYSSGMYARLGFAVSTEVDADILLIDEILGVGDEAFQKKCQKRIQKIIDSEKTVILVSHNADDIRRICSRAILLNAGEAVFDGNSTEALEIYQSGL